MYDDLTREIVAEIEALRQKCEALRKDAERWRWARKNPIVLDDFSYYIDDEVETFVDEQIAAAPAVGAA